MSWASYVIIRGEKPATNALRFATREEAAAYGDELLSRWFVPESHEERETPDPVNYRFDHESQRAVRIEA